VNRRFDVNFDPAPCEFRIWATRSENFYRPRAIHALSSVSYLERIRENNPQNQPKNAASGELNSMMTYAQYYAHPVHGRLCIG